MHVFFIVLGSVIVVVGLYMAITGRGILSEASVIETERFRVSTRSSGAFLTVVGALVLMFMGQPLSDSERPAMHASAQQPAAAQASSTKPKAPPDISPPEATETQPAPPPTETAPPGDGSAADEPPACDADASETPSQHGPWEGNEQGVHLVVERLDRPRDAAGRIRIRLRLENNSDEELTLTPESFLAVDDRGIHHNADDHGSEWDDDTTLEPGERQAGNILLEDKLADSTALLDISFNPAAGSYFPDRYITVSTTVPLPGARAADAAATGDGACG